MKSLKIIASLLVFSVFVSASAVAQDLAAAGITIDRVYEDQETGEFVDDVFVPQEKSFKLPNDFVVVSDAGDGTDICYAELDIDDERQYVITARDLDSDIPITIFSPSGKRYEVEKRIGLKGLKGQNLATVLELDEIGCNGVIALLTPAGAPVVVGGAINAVNLTAAALVGYGIYILQDDDPRRPDAASPVR